MIQKIKDRITEIRRTAYLKRYELIGILTASAPAGMLMAANAADDLTTNIQSVANKFYAFIVGIISAIALVCCAFCIFQMMFSKDEKQVQSCSQWLKRIIIGYVAIILLGVAVTTFSGWFSGGTWKTIETYDVNSATSAT